jgi:hypothetical protein
MNELTGYQRLLLAGLVLQRDQAERQLHAALAAIDQLAADIAASHGLEGRARFAQPGGQEGPIVVETE